MPLGLPKMIAGHTFPLAQKTGITSRKSVNSFDDVLHLTGNTDYRYLKKSVLDIKKAIQNFNPDVVYSEFNISAIIAGRMEKKKIFITASIPTQFAYANCVGILAVIKIFFFSILPAIIAEMLNSE